MPQGFNPRAPCGARPSPSNSISRSTGFQSTRPVRGATWQQCQSDCQGRVSIHAPRAGRDLISFDTRRASLSFNPRAPCGARPPLQMSTPAREVVSIHAPRAGRDSSVNSFFLRPPLFQSTPPRAGRDFPPSLDTYGVQCFNPRAPCGARQIALRVSIPRIKFQSTRPVRGATGGGDYRIGD